MITEAQYLLEKKVLKGDCPPDSSTAEPAGNGGGKPIESKSNEVFQLLYPEIPLNGAVNWETDFIIENKPVKVECVNSRVETKNEKVKALLVSQGWILTKTTKGEYL